MHPEASERPVVLYVEDHPINAMLMEALFMRRPDLELVVAADGAEALRVADGLHPALLLLDLDLPDTHGALLLAQLRRLEGCAGVPAVAVTADAVFDTAAAGFAERWLKPMDLLGVLKRLNDFVPARGAMPPPLPAAPAAHAAAAR
jgi:CheY-like chemotaxis protein